MSIQIVAIIMTAIKKKTYNSKSDGKESQVGNSTELLDKRSAQKSYQNATNSFKKFL